VGYYPEPSPKEAEETVIIIEKNKKSKTDSKINIEIVFINAIFDPQNLLEDINAGRPIIYYAED